MTTENASATRTERADLAFRLIWFIGIVAGLNLAWGAATDTRIERLVIDLATVRPATFLVNLLTPDIGAQAVRWSIRAAGGGLNIVAGCDGIEIAVLLIAAFLVAPISWRSRWLGVGLGLPFVYALNQVRILVLFYMNRVDKPTFDLLHTTALPVALVIIVAIYFYGWLVYDARRVAQPA